MSNEQDSEKLLSVEKSQLMGAHYSGVCKSQWTEITDEEWFNGKYGTDGK